MTQICHLDVKQLPNIIAIFNNLVNVHLNPAVYIVWSTNLNVIFPWECNFSEE